MDTKIAAEIEKVRQGDIQAWQDHIEAVISSALEINQIERSFIRAAARGVDRLTIEMDDDDDYHLKKTDIEGSAAFAQFKKAAAERGMPCVEVVRTFSQGCRVNVWTKEPTLRDRLCGSYTLV